MQLVVSTAKLALDVDHRQRAAAASIEEVYTIDSSSSCGAALGNAGTSYSEALKVSASDAGPPDAWKLRALMLVLSADPVFKQRVPALPGDNPAEWLSLAPIVSSRTCSDAHGSKGKTLLIIQWAFTDAAKLARDALHDFLLAKCNAVWRPGRAPRGNVARDVQSKLEALKKLTR